MSIQINIKKKIYVNILQEQNNAAKISSQHQTIKPQGQEKLTNHWDTESCLRYSFRYHPQQ